MGEKINIFLNQSPTTFVANNGCIESGGGSEVAIHWRKDDKLVEIKKIAFGDNLLAIFSG